MLKLLNYHSDQKGIINRYLREKENWDSHLTNTKEFILRNISFYKNGKIAVLGSGWLLDIPIIELLSTFNEVFLFDISHPLKIKNRFKKCKNVNFVVTDLTDGYIDKIHYIKKRKVKLDLMNLQVKNDFNWNEFDLVISVNLLNQLDILLKENIRKLNFYNEIELLQFSKIVQNNHINTLPKNRTILITDYKEKLLNENNEVMETKDLIFGQLPQTDNYTQWEWIFDTKMFYNNNFKTVFDVRAFNF